PQSGNQRYGTCRKKSTSACKIWTKTYKGSRPGRVFPRWAGSLRLSPSTRPRLITKERHCSHPLFPDYYSATSGACGGVDFAPLTYWILSESLWWKQWRLICGPYSTMGITSRFSPGECSHGNRIQYSRRHNCFISTFSCRNGYGKQAQIKDST